MGTRVYVGGLSYRARERDLEKFFKGYGRIREILLKNGYGFVEFDDYRDADDAVYELNGKELLGERVIVEHARGPIRRSSKDSYGYNRSRATWIDKVTVEKARGTPRGSDLWRGRSRGRGPPPAPRRRTRATDKYGPPTRTEYRLIVENLSSRVSWQDLKDFMRQAGEVTYADAHKQRRNEGVVEFASFGDMRNALDKLDDSELNGRRIRLVEDRRRRRSRSRSYTRSRSRSRSRRSRSRSRSHSRSRSRSHSRTPSRSKSKSPSRSRSGHSNSQSRSRSHSESHGGSRSKSHSASRSKSREKSRSKSKDFEEDEDEMKGSKSRSPSQSQSPSGSRSQSRSRSHSQSISPHQNHIEEDDDDCKKDYDDDD